MKFNRRKVYIFTYLCFIRYKILNSILFLNEKLFVFQMKNGHYVLSVIKKERHRWISVVSMVRTPYPLHLEGNEIFSKMAIIGRWGIITRNGGGGHKRVEVGGVGWGCFCSGRMGSF